MADIYRLDDHMAALCTCGSVHFNLLKSGKIECSGCQKVMVNWSWSTGGENADTN